MGKGNYFTLRGIFPSGKTGEVLAVLDANDLGLTVRTSGYDIWPEIEGAKGLRNLNVIVGDPKLPEMQQLKKDIESLGFFSDILFEEHEVKELTPEEQKMGAAILTELRLVPL